MELTGLVKTTYPVTVLAGAGAQVLPFNQRRAYLLIANPSTAVGAGNLWLNYGQEAQVNGGMMIQPGNGVWEESLFTGVSVQAIYLFNDGIVPLVAVVIEGLRVAP